MKTISRFSLFSLFLLIGFHISRAQAATSTWTGPGSDFNTAGNWDTGVPTDIAGFGVANPTSLSLSASASLTGLTFNTGAAAYTVTLPSGFTLAMSSGIINNSGVTQTIVNDGGLSGQLQFNQNATAGNAAIITNNGTTVFNNSATASSATLTVNAGGTLTFGTNSTAANATIINNGGNINFQGSATAGNATISSTFGQIVFGGTSAVSTAQLTTNNANIYVYSATTIGSLAGSASMNLNSSLTVGANNLNTTFLGFIYGNGSLTKIGNGTFTLTGNNIYTGLTTVNGGTLNILFSDQPLAGDVVVGPGGTLAGNPTMGNITNNGIVAPTVTGTHVMTAANYTGPGTLQISFAGPSVPSLHVTGNATITGGTLQLAGPAVSVGRYDVLSAGSITGTFATITAPSASYLTILPQYTPTDALVLIDFASKFSPTAQTGNERSVAAALDGPKLSSTPNFTTAIGAISGLSAPAAQNALDQISGDALGSVVGVGLRSAAVFADEMRDRGDFEKSTQEARLAAPVQLAYLGDARDMESVGVSSPSYGLWSRAVGFLDKAHADSSLGSPASNASTGGFQAGYDFLMSDDFLFGVSGGYAKTTLNVDDRFMSGVTTSLQSGIYASYVPGVWAFYGSVSYTGLSNTTNRSIVFPGINEQASADFTGRVLTTYAEARYTLPARGPYTLEPSFSLRQSHLQQEGYTETGAPGLNLAVGSESVNSLVSDLGVRVSHHFLPASDHPYTLGARIGWDHEFQNTDNAVSAGFAEANGPQFTVQGTPRSSNAAAIGLDGSVHLAKNLQGFAAYSATLGMDQYSNALWGGLRLKF